MKNLEITPAYTRTDEIHALFSEYTEMLVEGDETFKEYLKLQNYDEELDHPEVKYQMPKGRLYLALWDGVPAGCIGLKKIDEDNCEMKRLYVRPQFRKKHIADALVSQIITDAKEIGYTHMLLDTLPFLQSAVRLYKKYGFYEIPRYNDSPMDHAIYMKLDLA